MLLKMLVFILNIWAIGIGSDLAATPSHTTVRTDRVYGGSAGQEGY